MQYAGANETLRKRVTSLRSTIFTFSTNFVRLSHVVDSTFSTNFVRLSDVVDSTNLSTLANISFAEQLDVAEQAVKVS